MIYPQGTAAAVIAAALDEVGTIEQGDNLTKYGEYTGANGLPWCGSFVNWCANEAGVKIPNMVGTAAGAQKMKDQKRWHTVPALGDLCFMDFPHDGVDRISHIGIVVKVGLNSVLCVEGNTSGNGDQRNGGMVMIKQRAFGSGKEVVGFGRPKFVPFKGDYPIVEAPKESATKPKKEAKDGKIKSITRKLGA
jgi:hypothetical protein